MIVEKKHFLEENTLYKISYYEYAARQKKKHSHKMVSKTARQNRKAEKVWK